MNHNQRGVEFALGENAIRCKDFAAMTMFYRDVLGLIVLKGSHSDGFVFFQLGESFGGHTSVLALFRRDSTQRNVYRGAPEALVTGG